MDKINEICIDNDKLFGDITVESLLEDSGDDHSFSNTKSFLFKKIDMNLNFSVKSVIDAIEGKESQKGRFKIEGSIIIEFYRVSNSLIKESNSNNLNYEILILDTYNLNISSISYQEDHNSPMPTQFKLLQNNQQPQLGTPLLIIIPNTSKSSIDLINSNTFNLIIYYSNNITKPTPFHFTFNTNPPFAYTDGEAIGARSCFPCQDRPSVKFTFNAKLSASSPLTPLISALKIKENLSEEGNNVFYYTQISPVASYMVVFALGCVREYNISDRISVISESNNESCFAQAEAIVDILSSKLRVNFDSLWKKLVFLVVPYYAFSGMENPYLIYISRFCTSSKTLILHEIIHSWIGNCCTMKDWKNYWITEGITTYLEFKIRSILWEDDYELNESITLIKDYVKQYHKYTPMVIESNHEDPNTNWSMLPYYKGALFMFHLEKKFGEDNVMILINGMVNHYRFQSLDSEDLRVLWTRMICFLKSYNGLFPEKHVIEWDDWFYGCELADFDS